MEIKLIPQKDKNTGELGSPYELEVTTYAPFETTLLQAFMESNVKLSWSGRVGG